MNTTRKIAASVLDGLAWALDWLPRGLRAAAGRVRPTDGGPRPTVPK